MSEKIFNLKTEVLEVAAAKKHDWEGESTPYGQGNETHYGHVKLISNIDEFANNGSHGVSVTGLLNYIEENIPKIISNIEDIENLTDATDRDVLLTKQASEQLIAELLEEAKTELSTEDIKYSYTDEEEIQETTLTNKINSIDQKIQEIYNPDNIDLKHPKTIEDDINIDTLLEPGYYHYDKEEDLTNHPLIYNEENIHYQNALIIVEKQPNQTVLQYIYATQKQIDSTTDTTEYIMDGTKFLRTYTNNRWNNLSLIFTPPKMPCEVNPTHNDTNITIQETTAGFIFNWQQSNNNSNSYTIQEDLYEYETIGIFSKQLPIGNNPYIFGNLIGKVDVKIVKDSIAIRSTLSSGNLVKNVNATFFVPRIE